MTPKYLVLTRGLPAAGKSTWARQWVADGGGRVRVNRDDLRAMLFGPGYVFDHTCEELVTRTQRDLVASAWAVGRCVVVDDTNLRPKYVRAWQRFAAAHDATVELVDFPVDVDEAVHRDRLRDHPVGEAAIRDMAAKYLPGGVFLPVPPLGGPDAGTESVYVPTNHGYPAWIVDVDGTVALRGDRDPYDETTVSGDTPNAPVVALVKALRLSGRVIVFMSGRHNACRADTEAWLVEHVGKQPGEELFMRGDNDGRTDFKVKYDLFDTWLRHDQSIRVEGAVDDRQQVVNMWRRLGLVCAQVAPGDF